MALFTFSNNTFKYANKNEQVVFAVVHIASLKYASAPRFVFHNKLPEVPKCTKKLNDNVTLTK